MLKRWPVLATWLLLGAALVGTIALVTYEEKNAAIEYGRKCQAKSAAVAATCPKQKISSGDECRDPKEYVPWGYILIAWPDGITAWAIIATGFVIAWQSNETRRAARAALRQASLMKQQIEIGINKEKARISVKMMPDIPTFLWPDYIRETSQEPLDLDRIAISVTNDGQTSAYESEMFVTIGVSFGDDGSISREVHRIGTIRSGEIPAKVELNFWPIVDLEPERNRAIKDGTAFISIFRVVLYKTAFKDERVPAPFCFKWRVIEQEGNSIYPYGGRWEDCPKETQPEHARYREQKAN